MRTYLLLAALVPGLAFAVDDSGPKADALPVSRFSTTDPEPKPKAPAVPPFSAAYTGLKTNVVPAPTSFDVASSALRTSTLPASRTPGIVYQGEIVVVPDNEDRPAPEKNRWAKFEEALGPGRSANSRFRTYGWRNNDGTRVECYAPCLLNCCVGSGGFSTTGDGFGF